MKYSHLYIIFVALFWKINAKAHLCQGIYRTSQIDTNTGASQFLISANSLSNDIDLDRIQNILFGEKDKPTETEALAAYNKAINYAQQELSNLGGYTDSNYQRLLVQQFMDRELSPTKYDLIYTSPKTMKESRVEMFDILRHRYFTATDAEKAVVAQTSYVASKVYYLRNLQDPHFTTKEVDPNHCHQFILTEYSSEKQGKIFATMRLLEKSKQSTLVLEWFLNRNLDEDQFGKLKLIRKIEKAVVSQRQVLELSRVSNGSDDKKLMTVQRLLLKRVIADNKPSALFVLSTTQEKLVAYYQKWGFELDDIVDVNGSKIYLMSTTSENLK